MKEEILQKAYNIDKATSKVLLLLLKEKKGLLVLYLCGQLDYSRSCVQKALIKLQQLGLVNKAQENTEPRGFRYVYYSKTEEEVLKEVKEIIGTYMKELETTINTWKE